MILLNESVSDIRGANLILFLQISDWLNLEQDMLKKQIVEVGNIDAISEAIDKQKVRRAMLLVMV